MSERTGHKKTGNSGTGVRPVWATIFNSMTDLVTIHDGEFNILFANEKAQKTLRLPSLNGTKVKCYRYYHGKKRPPEYCLFPGCISKRETVSGEIFEPRLNSFFEVRMIPRLSKAGRLSGLIHIFRDVTDRKRAEDELQKHRDELMRLVEERTVELTASNDRLRQEIMDRRLAEHELKLSGQKFRNLYDNAPDMYHSLNMNKIIIECNETEARMLGYSKEEIIGRPLADFFTEESARLLEADFPLLKRKKVLKNIERTFVRKDGATFPAMLNVFAEFDEQGEIIRTRAIARDITELKKARAEQKLAEAEALRAGHLASLGEVAAGVAHEINNPVNGVLNYAQMLANKSAPGGREHDIAVRIIKEGERIASIVRSLLSFTRNTEEEKTAVHISDMISEVLSITETQVKKDGIQLTVDISPGLPQIIAIPQQIEQVFLNIISNARYALNRKYQGAHPGKIIRIKAEKTASQLSPHIRVIFHDSGTGIPPENINKVMNPFFSTKPVNMGTGLGLSISHGIIISHGGKITIESSEGEYTRVIIDLPENIKN
ncbi:MAG: PAS domain S-box protein [Nitrospiraceae bacterium]|nr:MAG: PAS domain S-box protein [Nitrospiraceae bacterium]